MRIIKYEASSFSNVKEGDSLNLILNGRKERREQEVMYAIEEILTKEKVKMKAEYNHGSILLTENHLLWMKKKEYPSAVISLDSIRECGKITKLGVGVCFKVVYGKDEEEKIFPLQEGWHGMSQTDDIRSFITSIETGIPSWVSESVTYVGGHNAYPEKHTGQLILTPNALTFQELIGWKSEEGNFKLKIPLEKIENFSIKETSELRTILHGYFSSLALPRERKFILVEYRDEIGMRQSPLFSFMLDPTDKRKAKLMRAVYQRIREIKTELTELR